MRLARAFGSRLISRRRSCDRWSCDVLATHTAMYLEMIALTFVLPDWSCPHLHRFFDGSQLTPVVSQLLLSLFPADFPLVLPHKLFLREE